MFPSYTTEAKRVSTKILIEGIVVRLLNGLNNQNVLKALTLLIFGNILIIPVITTMKSSQFHISHK